MHTQSFTIPQFLKTGLTHKKQSPVESPTVATCPFAGEWGEAHGCAFQRRKMRGVATNVYFWKTSEKPKENWSKRIFQVRELFLRLRKVLAPLTFVSKDNSLIFRIVWNCVTLTFFSFLFLRSTKAGLLLLRTLHRRGNHTYVVLF